MGTRPTVTLGQLLKLPVSTESGKQLGHVVDIELEGQELRLEKIYVRTIGIPGLFQNALIIHRTQIRSIEEDRIIVEDSVGKAAVEQPAPLGTDSN